MEINDLPHSMRFGRSPRQFIEMFDDMLAGVLTSEEEAVIVDVTAHCHCYGRPGSAWAYEAIAKKTGGRGDIWVTTRDEIAAHVRKALG